MKLRLRPGATNELLNIRDVIEEEEIVKKKKGTNEEKIRWTNWDKVAKEGQLVADRVRVMSDEEHQSEEDHSKHGNGNQGGDEF